MEPSSEDTGMIASALYVIYGMHSAEHELLPLSDLSTLVERAFEDSEAGLAAMMAQDPEAPTAKSTEDDLRRSIYPSLRDGVLYYIELVRNAPDPEIDACREARESRFLPYRVSLDVIRGGGAGVVGGAVMLAVSTIYAVLPERVRAKPFLTPFEETDGGIAMFDGIRTTVDLLVDAYSPLLKTYQVKR